MKPILSNKTYDFLKWFAIMGLHLLGVAYAGIASEWGFPYATQVANTLDIIGTLLGAFLAWESYDYRKKYEVYSAPKIQNEDDLEEIKEE